MFSFFVRIYGVIRLFFNFDYLNLVGGGEMSELPPLPLQAPILSYRGTYHQTEKTFGTIVSMYTATCFV
jgi:hypothetical protein